MKALFDTSVLVAACVESHRHHQKAKFWLSKAIQNKLTMHVCTHTIAELYAVLTKLPLSPRILPSTATMLIEHNVLNIAHMINLTAKDYQHTIKQLTINDMSGGIIYDYLIYYAAIKSGVDKLITLNIKDFERFNSEGLVTIISPD